MNQNFKTFLIVLVTLLQEMNCVVEFNNSLVIPEEKCNSNCLTLSRKKRILPPIPPPPPLFPSILYGYNAATGVLVAIAVPIALHEYNAFVSYNFEANYNMANIPSDGFPGPLVRLKLNEPYPAVIPGGDASPDEVIARNLKKGKDDETLDDSTEEMTTEEPNEEAESARGSSIFKTIFTRVGIYTMIESRLNANGINGKRCLLHAICESSRISFLSGNGILGHIFHILLTPSTSVKENNLPSEYYKAEKLGQEGNCTKYEKACNLNLLNLFSTII